MLNTFNVKLKASLNSENRGTEKRTLLIIQNTLKGLHGFVCSNIMHQHDHIMGLGTNLGDKSRHFADMDSFFSHSMKFLIVQREWN